MANENVANDQSTGPALDGRLARHGGLSYLEIPAVDVRRSAAFYGAVLGWNVLDGESDHPKFMDQTGHLLGRWIVGRVVFREAGLMPYIYVDDISDVAKRVEANGGEIVKEIYAEGNLWVATFRDPAGNIMGLWQERTR